MEIRDKWHIVDRYGKERVSIMIHKVLILQIETGQALWC